MQLMPPQSWGARTDKAAAPPSLAMKAVAAFAALELVMHEAKRDPFMVFLPRKAVHTSDKLPSNHRGQLHYERRNPLAMTNAPLTDACCALSKTPIQLHKARLAAQPVWPRDTRPGCRTCTMCPATRHTVSTTRLRLQYHPQPRPRPPCCSVPRASHCTPHSARSQQPSRWPSGPGQHAGSPSAPPACVNVVCMCGVQHLPAHDWMASNCVAEGHFQSLPGFLATHCVSMDYHYPRGCFCCSDLRASPKFVCQAAQ